MDRRFTLEEARGLLPEVRRRADAYVELRAAYAEAGAAVRAGTPELVGGLAEAKSLEARVHEQLGWFTEQGIQVKGIAPLLVDFPATGDGRDILLCWLEGEAELAWYHPVELGFMGRRPIDRLSSV